MFCIKKKCSGRNEWINIKISFLQVTRLSSGSPREWTVLFCVVSGQLIPVLYRWQSISSETAFSFTQRCLFMQVFMLKKIICKGSADYNFSSIKYPGLMNHEHYSPHWLLYFQKKASNKTLVYTLHLPKEREVNVSFYGTICCCISPGSLSNWDM